MGCRHRHAAEETARLAALHRTQLLDTPRERRFDDLVQVAAQICGTPIALINLVDAERQWGKALVGLESSEAPREESFFAVAIETPDECHARRRDTATSTRASSRTPRSSASRTCASTPAPRSSTARASRSAPSASPIARPRELNPDQLEALQALARQAMAQIELGLALEQERESVRRLRELDRLRDQFLSTVSHELRTPLTSIRGWLDLLIEDSQALEDEQKPEFLARVDRNADRLTAAWSTTCWT